MKHIVKAILIAVLVAAVAVVVLLALAPDVARGIFPEG
jgi:hypothetical protein